jgi:hypothetical protein
MGIKDHVGVRVSRNKEKSNCINLTDILRIIFFLINWYR